MQRASQLPHHGERGQQCRVVSTPLPSTLWNRRKGDAPACRLQNRSKQSFFLFKIWYLAWRVTTISMHIMLAGHTKFAPDWCFGFIERKLRRTRMSVVPGRHCWCCGDIIRSWTEPVHHSQLAVTNDISHAVCHTLSSEDRAISNPGYHQRKQTLRHPLA